MLGNSFTHIHSIINYIYNTYIYRELNMVPTDLARYNLIFPDSVYKLLYDQAIEQKLSMGKFLNVILYKQATDKTLVVQKIVEKIVEKKVFECPYCLSTFDGANKCVEHIKKCPMGEKMKVVL